MGNLKIYSVSDRYMEYLEENCANVYSNKMNHRTHTRKYVGVVLKIDKFLYYVPMSSPKNSDYQIAGEKFVIKKSIVPIIRMIHRNSKKEKELLGTLRISHMISVPESEIALYDIDNEIDERYKDLIMNELTFIRENETKIIKNATVMYKQKMEAADIGYVKSALPFHQIEQLCLKFEEENQKEIP